MGHYTEAELLDYEAGAVIQKPFRLSDLVAHLGPPDGADRVGRVT